MMKRDAISYADLARAAEDINMSALSPRPIKVTGNAEDRIRLEEDLRASGAHLCSNDALLPRTKRLLRLLLGRSLRSRKVVRVAHPISFRLPKLAKKPKGSYPGVVKAIEGMLVAAGPKGITKDALLYGLEMRFPGRSAKSMLETLHAKVPWLAKHRNLRISREGGRFIAMKLP